MAALEQEMSAPNFWDNQETAQETVGKLKSAKAVLAPFFSVEKQVEELQVLHELASEAGDQDTFQEVANNLEKCAADLERLELQTLLSGRHDDGACYFSIHAGAGGTESCDWAEMMLRMFQAKASPPADIRVQDGDTITVGKVTLKVIHTPGHSPGGMALYTPGYVFTGDTLFVEGVGRTDLPGASWTVMASSIQEKLLRLPDDTVVLPGHNYGRTPTSTIANERRNNPFLR